MNKWKRSVLSAMALVLLLPIAAVSAADQRVVLGGQPFGLTMYTSGVVVINVSDDEDSPAHAAGVKENDIITKANGETVTSNEQLKEIVEQSGGEEIELSLSRGESPISLTITPQEGEDGSYTVGMWIRDSTAGLGTVTYFDEHSCSFGALGHGVNDRDTGILLPLRSGTVMEAEITSVTKAQPGVAGGLNGYMADDVIGEITVNTDYGIFGHYDTLPQGQRIACAEDDEIREGAAQIYCTLDDSSARAYDVTLSKLNTDDNNGRNMVVTVTDESLLSRTGGIVQGMSGSPIVQDGKLVGAVTHVFVNAPERGYGIAIGHMRSSFQQYGGY